MDQPVVSLYKPDKFVNEAFENLFAVCEANWQLLRCASLSKRLL